MLYSDYSWKNGVPTGIKGPFNKYEIITDPYGKRYLLIDHPFSQLIYDSKLVDFRHLNPRHQLGWIRESLNDGSCLIRDRDHFPQFIEKQFFKGELPILCEFYSLQGSRFAYQKIYYTHLKDLFNGVILYDLLEKPILKKEYSVDSSFEFIELQNEINAF